MEPSAPQQNTDRQYILLAFRILADFGAGLAVPVVALSAAGKWLDVRFGTSPWLITAGFALAAVASGRYIWVRAKAYGVEYEALGKKDSTLNK